MAFWEVGLCDALLGVLKVFAKPVEVWHDLDCLEMLVGLGALKGFSISDKNGQN